MTALEKADDFWTIQAIRVREVAYEEGFPEDVADDESFLFDLCDNGNYEPFSWEIYDAICAYYGKE